MIAVENRDSIFSAPRIITKLYLNRFRHDSFFLDTVVLNGISMTPNGNDAHLSTISYGVGYFGATMKLSIIDSEGQLRTSQSSQLTQSTYWGMNAPSSHIGLGRTNNYVEELIVGTTSWELMHYHSFSGIIPNSRLFIIPQTTNNFEWKLEVYMNPSTTTLAIIAVLLTFMGILFSVIYILGLSEKREDALERSKRLHEMNFNAL